MEAITHVVGAIVALLAAGCGSSSAPAGPRTRPPPLVSVSPVTVRDVDVEIDSPIELRALADVDVVSRTLGYLDAVLVDRGEHVTAGQVVAIVRPSDLPDQLNAARGVLGQADAALALARANAERARGLSARGWNAQQDLDQSTAALASAVANQRAARAQVAVLATRLREMRILAPLDGVVSERRLDPGALVGPPGGSAILTIVRMDPLRVVITVAQRHAARVELGQRALVRLDGLPGQTFTGQVMRIAPTFDPGSRTLDAEIRLPNRDGRLRPGMYGRGAIVLETHPGAVVVPVSAVQINELGNFAYTFDGSRVHRRAVNIGFDGGDWLEITRGLSPGDEIVTAGHEGLTDNAVVRASRGRDAFAPRGGASAADAGESGPGARRDGGPAPERP